LEELDRHRSAIKYLPTSNQKQEQTTKRLSPKTDADHPALFSLFSHPSLFFPLSFFVPDSVARH
jgi:hypothetical protein